MEKSVGLVIFIFLLFTQEKVTVAVSANMQYAFNALKQSYETKYKSKLRPVISSSGKLTAQIMSGAPFDIFLSADTFYPDTLYKSGLTTYPPKIYAYGSLILWSSKKKYKSVEEISKAENLAIADPELAPYGKEAEKVARKYTYGTNSRIVFGQNIGQVNNYIVTGVVDAGLTSKSIVMDERFKEKGNWVDIPTTDYNPIAQGVVIINRGQSNMREIEQFYTFLFSEHAQQILEKYGYQFINHSNNQ